MSSSLKWHVFIVFVANVYCCFSSWGCIYQVRIFIGVLAEFMTLRCVVLVCQLQQSRD